MTRKVDLFMMPPSVSAGEASMRAQTTKLAKRNRGATRLALRVGLMMTVLTVIVVSFGSAPQSSANVRNPAGAGGFAGPARDTGVRSAVRGSSAQFTSRNWDGYITYLSSEDTDFNTVQATWTEPTVTCPKKNAWTVFWVGLDGWYNGTVEQGGSSARCMGGVPKYTVWWEMFPTVAVTNVFTIRAGDKITASVNYKPGTATFVIVVTDDTTSRSFTENEKCASDLTCERNSADVIAEDVGKFGSDSYFPLADYGTMEFKKASVADVNGNSGGISNSNWLNAAVTESSGATTYATVSALSTTGNSFKATWRHA
jgi:hypothetical protein